MGLFNRGKTGGRAPAILSISQIRMIELVSIFCIVFVAKEIAGFTWSTGLIVIIFLSSALVNLFVAGIENLFTPGVAHDDRKRSLWEWSTVFIDLSTVVALVYLTGTVESPFMFLFIIPLFFAGRLLPTMIAGFTVTLFSVAAVSTLGFLEIEGIIPHFSCYVGKEAYSGDPDYLLGSVLVLAGFMSFMTYLFNIYHSNFQVYFRVAEDRLASSKRRILELTRLYDISLGINSVISLDTLLKMVCKEITLLLRRPWAAVVLLNQKKKVVKHVELGGQHVTAVESKCDLNDDPLIEEILGHEDGKAINDIARDEFASGSPLTAGRKLDSLLAVPIFSGRENIGIMMVGDRYKGAYTQEDFRLMTILSGQMATAIEKSKLYEVMSGRIEGLSKENDNLKNANKLKMSYISRLSHELKTPLTSIKAYMESLKEHIDDSQFRERGEFLDIVASETDRLIRMVNKVLDVSKIEFGQRTLRRKLFELAPLVADAESSMQPYLRDRRLHMVVKLPAELPLIDGDADLIKQVLINLISNAIKFSPNDSNIIVEAVEDAVSVKVTVRDEGMGIPEEDIDNIFKQFYQVNSGIGGGAGLGLAIVKNIISQHGGYISVSSQPRKGSEFTFTLPKEHHFNDQLGYVFDSMDAKEELQEMFQLAVKVIAEIISAKIVSIMLLDQERRELFIKVAYGLDVEIVGNTRVPLGGGVAGKVAESGEPLLVTDVEESGITGAPNNPQYETKSLLSVPLKVGTAVIGVINANNKTSGRPFTKDDLALLVSLSQRLSKVIERMRAVEDSHVFLRQIIQTLHSLLASSRRETRKSRKIVPWSAKVARKLRLGEKKIRVVQYVSSVHDVGMTCISDSILKKTLDLTAAEVEEIRKHPQQSAAIIRPLEFVELVTQNILFHHERIDGMGYPMGLKGEQIPIGSRILAVLDAFVSMISERPFRKPMTPREAIDELVRNVGTQFDSKVIAAFVEVMMDEGEIEVDEYTRISDALRCKKKHHTVP